MRLLVLAVGLSLTVPASAVSPPASAVTPRIIYDSSTPPILFRLDRPASEMPVINPNGSFSRVCPPTSRYEAARRGGKLPPSLLTELPGADMYNAVYRKVDGCEVPMVVRYDVGGPSSSHR